MRAADTKIWRTQKKITLVFVRVVFLSRLKPRAANFKRGWGKTHNVILLYSYIVPNFET